MTERQKRFADEYLIDLNATRAYKAAYPSVKKDESARKAGSRLLTFVDVAAYIAERQKARQERTEITQDMVVRELRDIALAEASDENDSAMKYAAKLKALELLGKHLGMFTERVAISSIDDETRRRVKDLLHG